MILILKVRPYIFFFLRVVQCIVSAFVSARHVFGGVGIQQYLGGLLDLTGELNRYAVARATQRDSQGVKECLETVLVVSYRLQGSKIGC